MTILPQFAIPHHLCKICITAFLIISNSFLVAQPQINWINNYGYEKSEIGEEIIATSDGGYIVVGGSNSNTDAVVPGNPFEDYFVVKLDASGIEEWKRRYGGSGSERAMAVKETDDGGYIIAGGSGSGDYDVDGYKGGGSDVWILKLNEDGSVDWKKNYGGSGSDQANSIVITDDGGYVIGGYSSSNDGDVGDKRGASDMFVMKISKMGEFEWSKVYGGSGQEIIYSLEQTNDGGFIAAGYTKSTDGEATDLKGGLDIWILKLNNNGDLDWEKTLGGQNEEVAHGIIQTQNDDYIVAGYTFSNDGDVSNNFGNEDSWIISLDDSGNINWERCYGGFKEDRAYDLIQMTDGNIIVAGRSRSSSVDVSENFGSTDVWLKNISPEGELLWEKSLGGSSPDAAYSLDESANGEIVVTGNAYSVDGSFPQNFGPSDLFVINFDPFIVNVEDQFLESQFNLYPNPARDQISIDFNGQLNHEINIYDTNSKLIKNTKNSEQIEISTIPAGIYFLELKSLITGQKMVKRLLIQE